MPVQTLRVIFYNLLKDSELRVNIFYKKMRTSEERQWRRGTQTKCWSRLDIETTVRERLGERELGKLKEY